MANPEHVELVMRGARAIEEWRRENPHSSLDLGVSQPGFHNYFTFARMPNADLRNADLSGSNLSWASLYRADLSNADLRGANLTCAELSGACLSGADLSGAKVGEADLSGANLSEADLSKADLSRTSLSRAGLRGADLNGADLCGANLSGADLSGSSLSGVRIRHTHFTDVDLSEVRGLEVVAHEGPSSVGIDTIFRSKGKIPEAFLRGCGVPEEFIVQIPALVGAMQPIQFYSCFLSHATPDKPFVRRLYDRMVGAKMRVWLDEKEMLGGRKTHKQIEDAIRLHDKLILVLSENSMKSEWVAREIRKAWQKQQKTGGGQSVLFPIRLCSFEALLDWGPIEDAKSGKDLCDEIRSYFIPDFSEWEDDKAFEAGFAGLVKALKAEGKKGE